MRLRAHNLLCLQGFVGKGYSPAFVANMSRVADSLEEDPEITVVGDPDALCSSCPHLADSGCSLHGEGTEHGIVLQDRDVMARLGIVDGDTLRWSEILSRIRSRIDPDDLDSICGACPWLPMGHCREGLSRLRRRPR